MWPDIQKLIDQGEFNLALDKLQKILDWELEKNHIIQKGIFNLKINLGNSNFDYIRTYANELIKKYTISSNDIFYYQINNILIESFWRANYFDEALRLANSLDVKLLNSNDEQFREQYGYLLYNLSRIYLYLGDFKKSQNFALQSLEIRKLIGSKIDLSESFNTLGIIHGYRGESNKAIESYEESLKLRREIGNKKLIAYSLNNIGENYRLKGDSKKALEYYDQCYEICSECNDIEGIRLGLVGKGTVYIGLGMLNKALTHYEECLSLFSETLSPFHKAEILFLIIRLKLIMKIDYNKELNQITALGNKFNDKTITFFVKLAKAYIVKEHPRIKIKLTAQDLFEEILHESIVIMEFTVMAMESLVELYLIELQISDNTKLLAYINQLIKDMLKLAKSENFYPLMIRTIILQARLALLNDDIGNCLHILESAEQLADERELDEFLPLIERENIFISEQLSKWKLLIESDASMYQKIKESNILNYLQDIRRIVNEEEK